MHDETRIDCEDFLTAEDKAILRKKFRKDMRVMIVIALMITAFVVGMSFSLTIYHWVLGFMAWLTIVVIKFFRNQYLIDRGKKQVLRGVIAQRYEAGGGEDEGTDYVFYINGKRLAVPLKIYREYYTRDLVEIHQLEGTILQHKLLKRGKKEFQN
jgi:hypothetical protein